MTVGEEAFNKRLKAWVTIKKESHGAVGVMLRTTERERWSAWRTYFDHHDCQSELNRMRLCENGRAYSTEPETYVPWMQVPAAWPSEFDATALDERDDPRTLGDNDPPRPPPRPPATSEERERAVAAWEQTTRREIAPAHMQPRDVADEAVREAALDKLTGMARHKGDPLPKLSFVAVRAMVQAGKGDFELSPEDEARIIAEAKSLGYRVRSKR